MEDYYGDLPLQINQLKEILSAITDMMPDRHFIIDQDGVIISRFGNTKVEQFYHIDNYEPRSATELTSPENSKKTMKALKECLATGQIITYEVDGELSELIKVRPNIKGPASKQWFEVRLVPLKFLVENKRTVIVSVRNITDRKQSEIQLQELVVTDALTELFNRRYATEELTRCLKRFLRYKTPITILVLDIDFFKMINDTYGHDVGDLVLVELGKFLKMNVRSVDTLARLGGEEFILIMPDVTLIDVQPFCQRLIKNIANFPIPVEAGVLTLTMSGGLTQFTEGDKTIEGILKRADIALYRSKNEGRNCITSA